MSLFRARTGKVSSDDNPLLSETYVKLLGVTPLLKISVRRKSRVFFLFCILPVFKTANKTGGER